MPGKTFAAFLVGIEDRLIWAGRLFFHPRKQSRAEVIADMRVIVDELYDSIFGVSNSRRGIRCVTLSGDALIPVVVRVSGILQLHRLEIRILAGGLIKMSVDTNVFHAHFWTACFRENTIKENAGNRISPDAGIVISGGKSASGPLHLRSAEQITVDHWPLSPGEREINADSAKLKSIANCSSLSLCTRTPHSPRDSTV